MGCSILCTLMVEKPTSEDAVGGMEAISLPAIDSTCGRQGPLPRDGSFISG